MEMVHCSISTSSNKVRLGGGRAAAKIMESIKDYMDAGRRDEIWVYVFLNKKGLKALFQRHNRPVASYELDDFVIGMNEAAKTIMVVDVGQKKEAADSKIKVLLDSEVRSLETRKVFFAGSHDNGYVTELRAQVTSGYKEKLVLVPSYTEVASGYKELELATLSIPDLFMSEKLPYAPQTPRPASLTLNERPESGAGKATAQVPEFPPGLPVVEAWSTMPSRNRAASSSRTAELSDRRNASPGDDDRDSTGSGAAATSPHLTNKGRRHINPALPLSKQKPPPCTLFYLADACKHESTCKYGHNYILNDENYEEMRLNARKTPCQATNAGMICTWGENCCYGHKCPFAPSCHFFKLGKCKFEQKDMHRVSK
ncbi:hypothetical protein BKA70DRAFT_721530 [Coprinopsis sp. MPI-PUGE-AT-0042]|nr:hypothetical protein BKA70DRAFT_721530 [Coprinopsis sp. MPI-PUGE-AT-0042]